MIEFEGIRKEFGGGKRHKTARLLALDSIDLKIADNEFVAIIGPSGCGKTTLLRILAGLVPADGGSIRIDEELVEGPSPERAMVFQNFALLPWADVLSNVAFGLKLRKVPKAKREAIAKRLIERVGLSGFERHLPGQLSGGMQQRVGLARALAVDPKVLLMDEPFGALDEQTRRVLWEELLNIWERERKTVVFVTHSMEEAVVLADRIVLLCPRPGRVHDILTVDIARPRPSNIETARGYAEVKAELWEMLREMQTTEKVAT